MYRIDISSVVTLSNFYVSHSDFHSAVRINLFFRVKVTTTSTITRYTKISANSRRFKFKVKKVPKDGTRERAFEYPRSNRVRARNSLGWPRIGINRIPAARSTLQTEESANQFVNTVSSCRSRVAERMVILYRVTSVPLCRVCFFRFGSRSSARIREKPVRAIIFVPSDVFYRAKITSIVSSTLRLRRSNRRSYSWLRSSVTEYKFHCPVRCICSRETIRRKKGLIV